jgi:predicted MFS family arabinose efflux permease
MSIQTPADMNDPESSSKSEEPKSEEQQPTPRDWRFWVFFPTLCLSGFAVTMEGSIVATALPAISHSLHTTSYAWIINAYTFSATIFQPLTGWLAEVFGRKP